MTFEPLSEKAGNYLRKLCLEIPNRRVGSPGNQAATSFFAEVIASFGFETQFSRFDCIDWTQDGAQLTSAGESFEVAPSPYSLGCRVSAPLAAASTVEELEELDASNKILLLRGAIAREQLMPKHFPFYNPDEHRWIIGLLEAKGPGAIVAATSRNPEMAGGLYPFPLIEDGDFDIPSVFMTDTEGDRLAAHLGQEVALTSRAERIPAWGCNVLARKGGRSRRRVVVCAHIDAKDGTAGAIDNATGVTVLLLLAELLAGYAGDLGLEIIAFNGEDYYSAPGQVRYLRDHADQLAEIKLAANLDGLGYHRGKTAYSLYNCPEGIAAAIRGAFSSQQDTVEGEPWYQSDHSIFVQQQIPALAITSDRFSELWTQVAHTPRDRPEIVDRRKLVRAALALQDLLLTLDRQLPAVE